MALALCLRSLGLPTGLFTINSIHSGFLFVLTPTFELQTYISIHHSNESIDSRMHIDFFFLINNDVAWMANVIHMPRKNHLYFCPTL